MNVLVPAHLPAIAIGKRREEVASLSTVRLRSALVLSLKVFAATEYDRSIGFEHSHENSD
jgi:hypothetical protein